MNAYLTDVKNRTVKALRARTKKSAKRYAELRRIVPAGVMSRGRQIEPYPFFVAKAKGSRLWDIDGNEYVDCAVSYGAAILGHCHPKIVKAVRETVTGLTNLAMPTEPSAKLAAVLHETIPCGEMVTLCNSGAEATLHAIRIVRGLTGRDMIAKFEGGYHGDHDYVLASAFLHNPKTLGPVGRPRLQSDSIGIPKETLENTLILPFNHDNAFEQIGKNRRKLAVVMVEGLQGAGGCVQGERGFLKELREVTRRCGVPLLFDEVFTGFRLALGGAQEYYGVRADIATYAKIIGGGMPVGAIAGTRKVMKAIQYTGKHKDFLDKPHYGGTFNGNAACCAAGAAVIGHLRDHPEIYAKLSRYGGRIRAEVNGFCREHDIGAQMIGAGSIFYTHFTRRPIVRARDLWAIDADKQRVFFLCLVRHGLFIPNMHLGMISAAHTKKDVDFIIEAHKKALRDVEGEGKG